METTRQLVLVGVYNNFGGFYQLFSGLVGETGSPTDIFDGSLFDFAPGGNSMTLSAIGQRHTWTSNPPTPTVQFDSVVNLGTYTFTRVK